MDEVMWADTRALRCKARSGCCDQPAVDLVVLRIAGHVSRSGKR
jgi:hypothetical protein